MAGQGGVTYWVDLHRYHHTCSEIEGDIHSPQREAHPGSSTLGAFLRGHIGWVGSHKVPKPNRFALDLLKDPVALRLTKHYPIWMFLGLVLPGALGYFMVSSIEGLLLGVWYGGVVRLVLGNHIIWMVNSVCHSVGRRPHDNGDCSGNVWMLSLLTWG
jgi:stearoyl-CoA desaturase (delta-9 desaturase)